MPIYYKPQVRSRHGSHSNLKKENVLNKIIKKSVIRLGSTTEYDDIVDNGGSRIEINTVEAINNSSCKLRMKKCFTQNNVKTALWWTFKDGLFFENDDTENGIGIEDLPFPIISKSKRGSRGIGNIKHDNIESLEDWLNKKKDLSKSGNYIFEKYLSHSKEYRLHVTKKGCFYTCRKMLKGDVPANKRWFRNDYNCVWVLETNPSFDKPVNWDKIVEESVKALNSVGLDIGAVDVKVQSSTSPKGKFRENPDFFIIEINSAPSFGTITEDKYIKQINELLLEMCDI